MTDYNDTDKAALELEALDRAETADRSGKRQVWERMVGESAKAYMAFAAFRDLAEKRSFVRVAEMLGCSPQNVERWARRWNWLDRVYEHDLVEEEKINRQMSRDRMAHRRRQITIGQHFQSVAIAGLRELQAKIEQKLPLGLDPVQIAALQKIGDQLESAGLGQDREAAKYTRIVVSLGDQLDDPEPAAIRPALCDDATGDARDDDEHPKPN
jgi:hypothetical protein